MPRCGAEHPGPLGNMISVLTTADRSGSLSQGVDAGELLTRTAIRMQLLVGEGVSALALCCCLVLQGAQLYDAARSAP